MKVDYSKLSLSKDDEDLIHRTIEQNRFIPIKPYPAQLYAICDTSKEN